MPAVLFAVSSGCICVSIAIVLQSTSWVTIDLEVGIDDAWGYVSGS